MDVVAASVASAIAQRIHGVRFMAGERNADMVAGVMSADRSQTTAGWWANLAVWLIAFVVIVVAARLVLHP